MGKARVKSWQLARSKQRKLLWIAFAVMEVMFFVELGVGLITISASLQIDALETSSSKPVTDAILNRRLPGRYEMHMELVGGLFALLLCLWVVGVVAWNLIYGLTPDARFMAGASAIGLFANAFVIVALYRDRVGNSTLRSAWKTTRNDAVGNTSVLAAAIGVYWTGEAWPDAVGAAAILPFASYRAIATIRSAHASMHQGKLAKKR